MSSAFARQTDARNGLSAKKRAKLIFFRFGPDSGTQIMIRAPGIRCSRPRTIGSTQGHTSCSHWRRMATCRCPIGGECGCSRRSTVPRAADVWRTAIGRVHLSCRETRGARWMVDRGFGRTPDGRHVPERVTTIFELLKMAPKTEFWAESCLAIYRDPSLSFLVFLKSC